MEKKVILVTGASRGIGRAIAKGLAENDNIVIANYNKSEEEAKDLEKELQNFGKELVIYKADVSKREEVNNMVKYIVNTYGRIDILINNAGIDLVKLYTDVTDDDWNYVINNNLYSVFCTTQEVIKYMLANQKGCIINISSIFGIIGASCESIYAVSKAGIDGLTKSLAKEFANSNIRVNSIAPGMFNTDMNSNLTQEDIDIVKNEIPLARIGEPKEIVSLIKLLIENEYVTGQIIEINGGWHI